MNSVAQVHNSVSTNEYSQHSWRNRNFYRLTSNHLEGRYRNMAFNCLFHALLLAVVDNTQQMCTCQMYSFKECCIWLHLPCLQKEYHSSQIQCQYILRNRNSPLPIQSTAIIFGGLLFMMGPTHLSRFLHMAP